MRADSQQNVTELLRVWSQGDKSALEKLIPLFHKELRRLAHVYMARERPDHTLQTTARVNEAYLRLSDCRQVSWQNRAHFLAISAKLMRQILVDFARSRQYLKRRGRVHQVSLDEALLVSQERGQDVVGVDEALKALAAVDTRKSQVVELRFFGGLTVKETAEVLKVSTATVLRDWRLAKLWLFRELFERMRYGS